MAEVTDDMLMAYADADDVLSPLQRAKVELFLQTHPEARRRLEVFRATRAPLARLFSKPVEEPVPAHLKDFVLHYPLNAGAFQAQTRKQSATGWLPSLQGGLRRLAASVGEWLESPAPAARWQLAAASGVLLALGAAAGAFLHSSDGSGSQDLVAFHDGRLYASGPLGDALEKTSSLRDVRIGGMRGEAVTMRVNLTFKSKESAYCREYEVATPNNGGFVGLGCRDSDGKWALEAHLPAAGSTKGRVKVAGGNTVLDAVVNRKMDGDALGPEEENAAISGGWK